MWSLILFSIIKTWYHYTNLGSNRLKNKLKMSLHITCNQPINSLPWDVLDANVIYKISRSHCTVSVWRQLCNVIQRFFLWLRKIWATGCWRLGEYTEKHSYVFKWLFTLPCTPPDGHSQRRSRLNELSSWSPKHPACLAANQFWSPGV